MPRRTCLLALLPLLLAAPSLAEPPTRLFLILLLLSLLGLLALEQHVDRLAEDHANARRLAEGLAGIDGIDVDPRAVQTNMVFATIVGGDASGLSHALAQNGIVIPAVSPMRLVTHLDVDTADIDRVVETAGNWLAGGVRRAG